MAFRDTRGGITPGKRLLARILAIPRKSILFKRALLFFWSTCHKPHKIREKDFPCPLCGSQCFYHNVIKQFVESVYEGVENALIEDFVPQDAIFDAVKLILSKEKYKKIKETQRIIKANVISAQHVKKHLLTIL